MVANSVHPGPWARLLLASALCTAACGDDVAPGTARDADSVTQEDAAIPPSSDAGISSDPSRLQITASSGGTLCAGDCVDLQLVRQDAHEDDVIVWNQGLSGPGPHHVCPTETTRYAVELNATQAGEFSGAGAGSAELTLVVEDCANDAGTHDAGSYDAGSHDAGTHDAGTETEPPDPADGAPTVVCSQRFRSRAQDTASWHFVPGNQGISNDPKGNTVVTGVFRGLLSWDGGSLMSSSESELMGFVIKLDGNCKVLWSRSFVSGPYSHTVAVAQQFDSEEITLLVAQQPARYSFDWVLDSAWHYVQRLHADGSDGWRTYLGADYRDDTGDIGGIAVDPSNNVIVTGKIKDQLAPFAVQTTPYVLRYSSAGVRVGALTSTAIESPRSVTTSATGQVALAGRVFKSFAFAGGTVDASGAAGENLTLLDSGAHYAWDRMLSAGTVGSSYFNTTVVTRGRAGHVIVAHDDTATMPGYTTIEDWTTEGKLVWKAIVPGSASVDRIFVRAAPNGRVFFLADFQQDFEFGGKSFTLGNESRRMIYGSLDTNGKLLHVDLLTPDAIEPLVFGIGADAQNRPVLLSTAQISADAPTMDLVLTKMSH